MKSFRCPPLTVAITPTVEQSRTPVEERVGHFVPFSRLLVD
jgi:hypothetical protein